MGRSNKRSIPLGVPFTSPCETNKGNKIRVLSREALIRVTVWESIYFSVLRPVCIMVPAWSPPVASPPKAAPRNVKDCRPGIEAIAVKKVDQTIRKTDENQLTVVLRETPGKIMFCRIKNPALTKKIIPNPSGSGNLAIAVYKYQIKVGYKDKKGRIWLERFNSGTRCQQVVLESWVKDVSVEFGGLCACR